MFFDIINATVAVATTGTKRLFLFVFQEMDKLHAFIIQKKRNSPRYWNPKQIADWIASLGDAYVTFFSARDSRKVKTLIFLRQNIVTIL